MRKRPFASAVLFSIMICAGTSGFAAEPAPAAEGKAEVKPAAKAPPLETTEINMRVPLFSPLFAKFPVATVNDEPILMQEFVDTIASSHGQATEAKAAGKKEYGKVLNRLINIRLIQQEAANMGIDELPEIKEAVAEYAETHLRDMLKQRQLKDAKPDEKLVEQFYKEAVKEWKIRSIKFDSEENAKAALKEIEGGAAFDVVANRLIDAGKAEGAKEGEYLKPQSLLPQIADAVSQLKPGGVSQVVAVGPSFTILKLEDIRYPAGNAEAREAAQKQALGLKKRELITKYNDALTKKYVKINKKLLKSLNFESPKPGFDKLSKDKRVVAEMKGEKPITVADIADGIRQKFFHGIDQAIKEKKVNEWIVPVLNDRIYRTTFSHEARRLGIDKTEEYKNDVRDYKDSMVFGAFVQKVLTPEVKLTEEEIRNYYTEHIGEYSSPAMAKVDGLVFTKKAQAEDAADKLKKGTDLQWVKNNAEGQVDQKKREELLEFADKLLVLKDFPEPLQKVVADAKPGDIKLYESPDGFFYTLVIQDVFPPKASPLESERKEITKKIFGLKLNQAVEEWGEKLKKEYPVKIFVTDIVK